MNADQEERIVRAVESVAAAVVRWFAEQSPPPPPAPPPAVPPKIDLAQVLIGIGLSVRARKAARRLGVTTVDGLVKLTADELLAARNCGQTTLQEIREKLARKGLKLAGD